MRNTFITLFITFIAPMIVVGQSQKATTEKGEKVILNSDGTWLYEQKNKDISETVSSDCSNWIETTTDKVDGTTYTAAIKTLIVSDDNKKSGFAILIMKTSSGGIALSITALGAGMCIEKNEKINILFDDDSRLELRNRRFNCDGQVNVYFKDVFGLEKELNDLRSKKISVMRVWTNDGYVEKEFTQENKDEFFNVINCLTQ